MQPQSKIANLQSISHKIITLTLSLAAALFGENFRAAGAPRVFRDRVEPNWFADPSGQTNLFWYRLDLAGGERKFILVNAASGKRQPAFDQARAALALAKLTGREINAQQLPVESLDFGRDGKSAILHGTSGDWKLDLASYTITAETNRVPARPPPPEPRRPHLSRRPPSASASPDGRWRAFVYGNNLYLRDLTTGAETPLTYDANPDSTYARDEEFERGINMEFDARDPAAPTPDVYWSPDSKRLVAMRRQPGTDRRVYEVESSPPDRLQPKLTSYPYLKPGDRVPISKPRLFDIENRKEIPVSDALFANPWSITDLRWAADSSRFTFLFNQRGHQALRVLAVDAQSGAVKAIVDERSRTFIDYSGKFYCRYLDASREIIWMSERDGWNHLYLYDSQTGAVKCQVTRGQWVVRRVDDVDEAKRQIWFEAGGIVPGQDPYFVQICRVNFDGAEFKILTEGDGTHTARFSPDRRYLIDSWSRVDLPPVTVLRAAEDGHRICALETADASALFAAGWKPPTPFAAKGRDGRTGIYGAIWQPKNFDPNKKYPVVEDIYAGPQSSYTPKTFAPHFAQQDLADDGFVVVQCDGMGTSNRSKKFHDVCWKNLRDAGFPDRLLWIKAAAAKYRWMDLTRVGIYGTSAGAQDALRGILDHGDFYKACVADSGCYDNRLDKIWWNEQWMGWPVDESYRRSSDVSDARNLQGPLLLMVGELDKNVDPSSTLQVVNALIKANKDFELLYMPGAGHGVARTAYGWRRLRQFFKKNLLAPSPTQWRPLNAAAFP